MKWLDRWISLGLVLTLGCLLGMLGFSLWDKIPTPVARVAWSPEAQWIAPQEQSYRFYARKTFYVPGRVESGWLRLSADNDFVLHINGKLAIAKEHSYFNSSLGLANRLKEPPQDFNDSLKYRVKTGLNYLLASSRDWKLTVYIDLTGYLGSGKNVISLEVQKGQKNPRVVVEGVVYTTGDSPPIELTTGVTPWRVSTLYKTRQLLQFSHPDFPDQNWPLAVAIGPVREATYSRISPNLFDRIPQGSWIAETSNPQAPVWLRSSWQVPQKRKRAFIRLAAEGEYALLINGQLVDRHGVNSSNRYGIVFGNRYGVNEGNQLHMYEVTNFLHPGVNSLAVRLARPLDLDSDRENAPVGLFLDGWVETDLNKITAEIATDSSWSSTTELVSGWVEGDGQGQPVTLLRPVGPKAFQRQFETNADLLNYPDYLWHQSLWCLGGTILTVIYAWMIGRFWLDRRSGWWDSLGAGAALLLPGTLFLIGIGLLKHRYGEAEQGLLFAQSHSNFLILLGFALVVLLTLLSGFRQQKQNSPELPSWGLWCLLGLVGFVGLGLVAGENIPLMILVVAGISLLTLLGLRGQRQLRDAYTRMRRIWPVWGQWVWLLLIVGIGFGLRTYNLGFIDFDADEITSYVASRSILHTGVPLLTSGIWYTRGPFYHYLLAIWLQLLGDSAINARFLSVIWGTATLILVYLFTRKVTGKVWIALLVTAILAIDPWELWYSRFIRFYQVLQFTSILTFWSFLKGFVDREGRRYQYIFFIALTLTLLTQEVTVTILPVFLIGFLFFYRPFRLSADWPILLGSLMTLVIFTYNLGVVAIRNLTPWVALSTSSYSYLKFHLSDLTDFVASFFVGPNRIHTIYSLFFLVGFVYFLKRREGKLVFLFSAVLINIINVTILTYQTAERYAYAVYPLFVLLAIYSSICILTRLGQKMESFLDGLLPVRAIAWIAIAILLVSNIELGRVLASYQESIARRNTEIFEYIRAHRQPGDVVVSPTPPLAAISLGGLDYFLLGTELFDATYWHEGRLVDRWVGGVVVSNLDQLHRVLENSQRVWIHIDDAREAKFDVQTLHYSQILGKPVFETFGARLRLWQPEDGLLPRVPNQGKDLGSY